MSEVSYDVVGAEVHRKAVENLTNEMAIAMIRTSGSPVVVDAKDFSACFLDTVPEHLGFAAYITTHLGSSYHGTRAIMEAADVDSMRPGDGWLVNDPHSGGALHQGDVSVIMPTFFGDEHAGWAFVNMHVLDIGGVGVSGYAPGAHDVYEEGLRFPPIKIIRDGMIDSEWESFIAANVRAPDPVVNDIRSMIAGCNVASEKLNAIIDEFGYEQHVEFCQINKDLTERVMRERISRLPDGVYHSTNWTEFDGHEGPDRLLQMRLALEVDGDELRFNFTGVEQIDAFVNSAPGAMMGGVMAGIVPMLGYGDMPMNGGMMRPISIDLGDPGTVVNSAPPAPVSNAHSESGLRISRMVQDTINQALAKSEDEVLRGRVKGQSQDGFSGVSLFGPNQHGSTSVIFYVDTAAGVGGGAQSVGDGMDCYGCSGMHDCGIVDVEVHEAADPVLFLWRRVIPNTGGPGRTRGGQGMEQAFELRYSEGMSGPGFNGSSQIPPVGAGGGFPAATCDYFPLRAAGVDGVFKAGRMPSLEQLGGEREPVRSKVTRMLIERGDVVVVSSGGGAGLGDPLLRDPELVAADLRDGYVTAGHAEAVYGVRLGADGSLDADATAARRLEIRRQRIGGEPAAKLGQPDDAGISVRAADGGAPSCASCGHGLAASGEDWRDGAVSRTRPLDEFHAELSMHVRGREAPPLRLVRERFCPSCAAALAIEVESNGAEPQAPTPRLSA